MKILLNSNVDFKNVADKVLYNKIVSEIVEKKLAIIKLPLEKSCQFVNSLSSDNDVECCTTICTNKFKLNIRTLYNFLIKIFLMPYLPPFVLTILPYLVETHLHFLHTQHQYV